MSVEFIDTNVLVTRKTAGAKADRVSLLLHRLFDEKQTAASVQVISENSTRSDQEDYQ